jgi:hypothetical protein
MSEETELPSGLTVVQDVDVESSPESRAAAVAGMSDNEAWEFLVAENGRRVDGFNEATGGRVDLTDAFDLLKIKVYMTHICLDLGILERADLDFQGQKAMRLDAIETAYTQMMQAREVAEARIKLGLDPESGQPLPKTPSLNREQRRHGN